jgi:hypothetical protein
VTNVKDIATDVYKAIQCDVIMKPNSIENMKNRILIILPNVIKSYSSVRQLILDFHRLAPTQKIDLAHLDKLYSLKLNQNIEKKLDETFEHMRQTEYFGLRKNSIEILSKIIEILPNAVIINILSEEVDSEFENRLKKTFMCVYDKTIEFGEVLETTTLPVKTTKPTTQPG